MRSSGVKAKILKRMTTVREIKALHVPPCNHPLLVFLHPTVNNQKAATEPGGSGAHLQSQPLEFQASRIYRVNSRTARARESSS